MSDSPNTASSWQMTDDPENPLPLATAIDGMPERIGRYRIEKVLGEGGFGRVYLAHDDQLDRPVAIKIPHVQRVTKPEEAEAYLAEARVLASLDHPNIVPVHDIGTTQDGMCYVVSKVIGGSDLAKALREKRLAYTEAADLMASIAAALHYAHRKGLVHRDIKPGNILLDGAGKAYVADFGLALKEADFGKGAGFAGTPAYMSPEQARGEGHRVDGRSDIFSLGVVFYELLTGRRPFQGDSLPVLLEQITTVEPRPPRQIDDTIPMELERICFKALAKRSSERYTTGKDMADDLRHFLTHTVTGAATARPANVPAYHSQAPATGIPVHLPAYQLLTPPPGFGSTQQPGAMPTQNPGSVPGASSSRICVQQSFQILPKGLRSFDAHDADFFIELLPGPRDRDGLPDSIRFGKTRIEEKDPDNSFSVGLIYGPSGCGKSSLVKAGILPRLSPEVIAIYVEATPLETESRILNGLRKRCPSLPANLSLKDSLASLRRGQGFPPGHKVLIVLDQFEQWLHAKQEETNTELVEALRQCDGGRVQCLVMVRDDFWMAATRFMRQLEIRLVEGQNSVAVDLFDMDHGRKVLAAFGRAFGKLPPNGETTRDQKDFLNQAVAGLAQEGKIICVRLALFAEMMKSKPWTTATLKQMGGMAGVGVTFLEETFAVANAPPERRYHQKAARAVLKTLLPDTGADIKGHMRSYCDLLEASSYAGRPQDFEDLIRILDSELRLITPTDPEGKDEGGKRKDEKGKNIDSSLNHPPPSLRYYQLSHDYLVPSLRDWLTRKQKETVRGRAELRLLDRAATWTAKPENHYLPSWWEWCNIRLSTRKKDWTSAQRKMMRKATRYHAVRGLLLSLLLAVFGWGIYEGYGNVRAYGLTERLLDANTNEVPAIVLDMTPFRRWVDPLLQQAYAEAELKKDEHRQLRVSLALLPVDLGQSGYLYGKLLASSPLELPVIRDALSKQPSFVDKMRGVLLEQDIVPERRLRAACALASSGEPMDDSYWPQSAAAVVTELLAAVQKNPSHYSHLVEYLRPARKYFIPALQEAFRSRQRAETERAFATSILADYATDQPDLLAELLMDADEKQFTVLFPKLKALGERGLSLLHKEITKQSFAVEHEIFKQVANIGKGDAKIKITGGQAFAGKVFDVRLQAGKTYRFAMSSKELDSFLVLLDEAGRELTSDDDSGGNLDALLFYTAPRDGTFKIVAVSLNGTGSFNLTLVEMVGDEVKENLAKRQANAGVALLKMDQAANVWPMLRHGTDTRLRSYLIHLFGPLETDARTVLKRLEEEQDVTVQRALILSLGEFPEKSVAADERAPAISKLREKYRLTEDAGVHSALEWLLRVWRQETWLRQANEDWQKDDSARAKKLAGLVKELANRSVAVDREDQSLARWYVNGQGQTMVVIPRPRHDFLMGSPVSELGRQPNEIQHKKRIGRSFAIAAKEVTVEQFSQFYKDNSKIDYYVDNNRKFSPTGDSPVNTVSWYQAAAYCNWLSEREGIPEDQWCYEKNRKGDFAEGMMMAPDYLKRTGYRLPTEAEWEYACRAGSLTSRFYGETDGLLERYAWYSKNSVDRGLLPGIPGRFGVLGDSVKPNDFGLFDMLGNAAEWCQDPISVYKNGDDVEDRNLTILSKVSRVLRGASFNFHAATVRTAVRHFYAPVLRSESVGFRPARTIAAG